LFELSVCVVDNDAGQSAREVVHGCAKVSSITIMYICEPEQNIAKARNTAIEHAHGTHIAFIDDDEVPPQRWLLPLFEMMEKTSASGVLGPVRPFFETTPPSWVTKSKILERPEKETGEVLGWEDTRTGNVLLSARIFTNARFDNSFGSGGEDKEFFRRMIAQGEKFIWCSEAAVQERIPMSRCSRVFQIKRALLRGKVSVPGRFKGARRVAISCGAIVLYIPVLLGTLMFSHGLFMKYLIRASDHVGRILAFLGINLIRESYLS
jgi:succinoglycan biosynthesis protein ExoM